MHAAIADDIEQRVPRLGGRLEDVLVIAVGEAGAVALHHLVEAAGNTREQEAQPIAHRAAIVGLKVNTRTHRNEAGGPHAGGIFTGSREAWGMPALLGPSHPRYVPGVPATGDRVSRYLAGDHERVWCELRDLGPIGGSLRDEAAAVAEATMKRARNNVARITARLHASGYPFDNTLPPRTEPSGGVEEDIARIEEAAAGPCPIALAAFWRVVGEVYWKHSEDVDRVDPPWGDLPIAECDPLCVDGARTARTSIETLVEDRQDFAEPLFLDLAPDYLHKANISGGAPYGMTLPSELADPIFENEEHQLPFIDYLRLCLRNGGFSRFDRYTWSPAATAFVEQLRAGYEPF